MPETFLWPERPYKGLAHYGSNDVPLFAGRDGAVRRCAGLFSKRDTRLLILHGSIGCGKSSFLRAGLIPYLEIRGRFQFARSPGSIEPHFVRSTDSPLRSLAGELYHLASRGVIQMEDGPTPVDLSALLGCNSFPEFLAKAGNSGESLIESLRAVAAGWPGSLAIVLDQIEEVFTLKPATDADGEKARDQFFDFVSRFIKTDFDLKLIIAMRVDYFGRFMARIGRSLRDLSGLENFYLSELTEPEVVEVIKRPTLQEEIVPYGKPFERYRFRFEEGLPERIARDVISNSNIKACILPAVQIVCDSLYEGVRKKSTSVTTLTIKVSDYTALHGMEGQVEEYLKQKLTQFGASQKVSGFAMDAEVARWMDVLSELSMSQVDGTVVTQMKSKDDMQDLARKSGCRLPFEAMMNYLSDASIRIVCRVEVINSVTHNRVLAYSLGHDVIGMVLERWKLIHRERNRGMGRFRRRYLLNGGIFIEILSKYLKRVRTNKPA